jgi:two-component system sensor histidine kinase GlrK
VYAIVDRLRLDARRTRQGSLILDPCRSPVVAIRLWSIRHFDMPSAYPRSIGQLLLISYALVTVPLITALVMATVQVDRLARQSRGAVLRAETATLHSRSLVENVIAMERSLSQFYVLDDPGLHRSYLARRAAFLDALEALEALKLGTRYHDRLQALTHDEQALFDAFGAAGSSSESMDALSEAFSGLSNEARAVLAQSSDLIDREANNATLAATELKKEILMQASAVIPAALGLAILFIILIARPLLQIDLAIRRLGDGELLRPIDVAGPRDLRELGRRLDWLRQRILELEHQKLTFLRHVSHEFKTPLTAIREGADLLTEERSGVGAEDRQIVRIMRDSSIHLQQLIENLLEFAKTRNPTTLHRLTQAVAVRSLVERVLRDHALAIAAKDLTVDAQLVDVVLSGNADQLRIVLDNLLSNAIKFSPYGGRIRVSLAKEGATVFVSVKDSGPGVHPEDRARIFEPFYQGQAAQLSPVKGTGLGLSIAREYVEAHGGTLELVEEPGGALFRVNFTLADAA